MFERHEYGDTHVFVRLPPDGPNFHLCLNISFATTAGPFTCDFFAKQKRDLGTPVRAQIDYYSIARLRHSDTDRPHSLHYYGLSCLLLCSCFSITESSQVQIQCSSVRLFVARHVNDLTHQTAAVGPLRSHFMPIRPHVFATPVRRTSHKLCTVVLIVT